VQIIYERSLRPAEKVHEPWLSRVSGQLLAACGALEAEVRRVPLAATSDTIDQAGVTTAVAWQFTNQMLPEVVRATHHPALSEFSARAEMLIEFKAAPHGPGAYHYGG